MNYSSIDQVRSDFNMTSLDIKETRNALNQIRASIHPDKNGGVFANSDDELMFYKIRDAISFLDTVSNEPMPVPISQVSEMIKLLETISANISTVQSKNEESNSNIDNRKEELSNSTDKMIEKIRHRFFVGKISSVVATTLFSAVWLFPSSVVSHPVLGEVLYTNGKPASWFIIFWLIILCFTVLFWSVAKLIEEISKSTIDDLKLETYQNMLFDEFTEEKRYDSFTQAEFIDFINEKFSRTIAKKKLEVTDLTIRTEIADIVFSRAEKLGVIKEENRDKWHPKLITSFRLTRVVDDNLF